MLLSLFSMNIDIPQLLSNIPFANLSMTWLGAVCAHLFSTYKANFKGIEPEIRRLFPGHSDLCYYRLNFVLLPIFGMIIAYIFSSPETYRTCFCAGLSWTGCFTALQSRKEDGND